MADLVPEVAEQTAIRFVHFRATLLALRGVRLGQGDCDHAIIVAGHDLWRLWQIGQKLEDEPMGGVFGPGLERQAPSQQTVEQAVLGEFELAPLVKVQRLGNVRDRMVVNASGAKAIFNLRRDQPITDVTVGIGAEFDGASRRPPLVSNPVRLLASWPQ